MKIVILDAACVKQHDLNFECLKNLGTVYEYDRTSSDKITERIGDAEIVITNKIKLTKEILNKCPNLKYISVLATGYNTIDTKHARKLGIDVSNVPSYSTDSVVQHTFGLILNAVCGISAHNDAVKRGDWSSHSDFCLCVSNLTELKGKTLGIIGYGAIGRRVALIAKAFGMKVIFNTRTPIDGSEELNKVLSESDIISLHCPLTETNDKMINEKTVSLMKDGVIIINTARGRLIDESAVYNGLCSGKIAFFAADVLSEEPPKSDNPLLNHSNAIITSHIAWATYESRKRLLQITYDNISAFLQGKPINVIN